LARQEPAVMASQSPYGTANGYLKPGRFVPFGAEQAVHVGAVFTKIGSYGVAIDAHLFGISSRIGHRQWYGIAAKVALYTQQPKDGLIV